MVHNIKSLFFTVLIAVFSSFVFAQAADVNQTNSVTVENTVNSSSTYENDANYFNNSNVNNNNGELRRNSFVWTLIKIIFFLILVVVAIYFLMKFFKNRNNPTQSEDDFLRRVSSMTLAPGKSVEIVTLVDKGYLLGVTDGNISLISEIQDKELIEALNLNYDKKQNVQKPVSFADVLEIFMPKKNLNKNNIYNDLENKINKFDSRSFNNDDK